MGLPIQLYSKVCVEKRLKKCSCCKKLKDETEFNRSKDGLQYYCKICNQKYQQRPEVRQRQKEYRQEYYQRPEVKQYQKEYRQEYYQRPEIKQRYKEYYQRPEVKQRQKEYYQKYQRPEVKERQLQRKKQEMNK